MCLSSSMAKSKKAPRRNDRGKIYIGSILLVAVLIVGLYITSHFLKDSSLETESFAARGGTSSASPLIVEGEEISTVPESGGLQVIDDLTASGEKALMFSINTTANTQVTLPAQTSRMTVMAKGDRCKGNPSVQVLVDEKLVLNKNVSSTDWNDYTVNVTLLPGTHNVRISFSNDYTSSSRNACDRNLKVDQLIFQ